MINLRLKLAALSPKDKPCPMTGIGILGIEILGTFFEILKSSDVIFLAQKANCSLILA